jgi:predicted CoA-substrate-specific enzyme activase
MSDQDKKRTDVKETDTDNHLFLGIDTGSLYVSIVVLNAEGNCLRSLYRRHHGDPVRVLLDVLPDLAGDSDICIARTGSGGKHLPLPGRWYDSVVTGIEGAKVLAPEANNVLSVGGGSFSLIEMTSDGRYRRSTLNSACASGTGSFLDQQALRLQIPPDKLPERAMAWPHKPPVVATRCAVFAKSDMIHLQQEGYTADAIAAGLCRGLGYSTVDGLLGGRRIDGTTALIGGVALNSVVVEAINEKLGARTVRPENPELACAWGAAMLARTSENSNRTNAATITEALRSQKKNNVENSAPVYLREPLELALSDYPDFSWADHWFDSHGNEIAIPDNRSGNHRVTLGIDIGSTSTKAILLNDNDQVAGWVYRRTAGDPIRAVQLLFKAIKALQDRGGFQVDIQGVGTTGSGRKMIGRVIGADLVLNEITAHATAALFLDPLVDTILEIGGQDAKFTQLQNGMVYNSVMNCVCAAGTGSFIEEQALKLDIPLEQFADVAMNRSAPPTSDRCTVYMERDLDLLLAAGWEKPQIAAAVLHSVRDNYLNKVVGGLHIGDHVYFQGATARNRALVAAFEAGLKKNIRVSRYCHMTGALGMALLVKERVPEKKRSATFKGLEFAEAGVRIEQETCSLCRNSCRLTLIHTGGEPVAWGLKCGRDYSSRRALNDTNPAYRFWQERETLWKGKENKSGATGKKYRYRIGLLRSLGTFGFYPFWRTFLQELDCEVVFADRSSDTCFREGCEIASAEICAPVLMSYGHARRLLDRENIDYLFVPYMIDNVLPDKRFEKAYFCNYTQTQPALLRALGGLSRSEKILAPVISFNESTERQAAKIAASDGDVFGVGEARIASALRTAQKAQAVFEQEALALGRKAMEEVEASGGLGIVCVGRPYNTADAGLILDLPGKIAAKGYPVITLDMLPLDYNALHPEYGHLYWYHGQRILAAAKMITKMPQWFGIYFTHFMCGPDSYLMTYFKDIMGQAGKPYLCLQFDGHGADAGYLTRIEAALETFHAWSGIEMPGGDDTTSAMGNG